MREYKRLTNNNLEGYDPEYDFCIECKYFGEPNGCNRPKGTCDNYERFIETYNSLAELEDQGKQIKEMEKFIIKTRNILKNILLTNSRPIKNTSKKDCYSCLMKLQELYKSNNSISDEDFLKTLFEAKTPEDNVVLSKEEYELYDIVKKGYPNDMTCLAEKFTEIDHNARKEMAEKIYYMLKKYFGNSSVVTIYDIHDKIEKLVGVKIKE